MTKRMTPWEKMVKHVPSLKKKSEEAERALKELQKGSKDEKKEHGMSTSKAVKTAADHLRKDDRYYTKLDKIGLKEEIANVTGAAVPGTGDSGMSWRPKGKFGKYDTFKVSRQTFLSLKEAKKKGKHWRKYLEEDDAYHEIREYARKCKGPIVVEDESTGTCMFVRYGDGPLF